MTIVRALAAQLRGRLTVDSQPGLRYRLTFPAAADMAAEPQSQTTAEIS
jgi:signal transduction histidine kinase